MLSLLTKLQPIIWLIFEYLTPLNLKYLLSKINMTKKY